MIIPAVSGAAPAPELAEAIAAGAGQPEGLLSMSPALLAANFVLGGKPFYRAGGVHGLSGLRFAALLGCFCEPVVIFKDIQNKGFSW
jgi:hypothetical protein